MSIYQGKQYRIHTVSGMGADRVDHITWVTKEWTKLFLENWDRTVELWDKGHLFADIWYTQEFKDRQRREQQEYARLCCAWLHPFDCVEPHCVAEGL